MRNYIFYLSICFGFFVVSCSKSETDIPDVENPIIHVNVVGYPDASVHIDDENKKIIVSFDEWVDLSSLKLSFTLDKDVELTKIEETYDLRTARYLLLTVNNQTRIKYVLQAELYVDPETRGWTPTSQFGEMPDYITVYKSPAVVQNRNAIAYLAVVDLEKSYTFKVLGSSGRKTPLTFYEEQTKKPVILINAGFFNMTSGNSVSLIIEDSELLATNSRSEYYSGTTYYLTCAAIGQNADGSIDLGWVYTTTNDVTYIYPNVSPNVKGEEPYAEPSLSYPEGGKRWFPKYAVGAGPVLVKKYSVCTQMGSEMLDLSDTTPRPRTAIGLTENDKLLLVVFEGDKLSNDRVTGITLEELATEMKQLGCNAAMNMDGGGSSCMLVNGQQTIACPGRAVVSMIGIR
ncbi:MAG: phosphodiester glycosidase family protein [Bacteroidaceae bacterium]